MTSPIISLVNYLFLGLLLYVGVIGAALTLIPEGTKVHSWVQRVLLPSAISVMAMFAAMGMFSLVAVLLLIFWKGGLT